MLIISNPVVFRTVGWVLASIGYNSIIEILPAGPITDLVRTLDLVLTPQVRVKKTSTLMGLFTYHVTYHGVLPNDDDC